MPRINIPGHIEAQLVHFYIALIRHVLEYAAPVWHYLLTKTLPDQLEAMQERAVRIIYQSDGITYKNMLQLAKLSSLSNNEKNYVDAFSSHLNYLIRANYTRSSGLNEIQQLPDLELESPPVLEIPVLAFLSPVHTSKTVEATWSNATSRTIFSTKSNVASTKSNVASTLLLVWTGHYALSQFQIS